MSSKIELSLSRPNRIYRPSEPLEGKIVVKSSSSISHNGIRVVLNGSVTLQVRGGSAGVIESLYGVLKPIIILNRIIEIKPAGRIVSGTTEIPFAITLRNPKEDNSERFYETFHGTNISIQYLATADMMRGYLHKSLSATVEFIVESDKADLLNQPISPEMVIFYITQDTQRHPILPELKSGGFRMTGRISTQCPMLEPLGGELTVETSALPISSIDIHLLRVESVLLGEKIITESSLIQTTQIADGDVCRNMTMPIYVVLPRLLTCPTVLAGPFSIEFKVAVVITFQSELSRLHPKSDPLTPRLWMAMETLPLELVRTRFRVQVLLYAENSCWKSHPKTGM
ncbi:vacuolar protein sorting-associated protein 26C-like isoform X1 [Hibiscus syriacus]|uniref:vacuolar protein sorting-associated protein 26C-like isoform X1 n=1 Tax=Hibiscus syriacus TaxID=106335 RepID=UPI0019233443|nr:vacuolar protein sorting-associated protein 26C-like isoform X1 [Hibiscus syriacus]